MKRDRSMGVALLCRGWDVLQSAARSDGCQLRNPGRAMELGRECLALWGYKRVDELVWIKTNSMQKLIRTGRSGEWLNHSKEHCLVGVKGLPNVNRWGRDYASGLTGGVGVGVAWAKLWVWGWVASSKQDL